MIRDSLLTGLALAALVAFGGWIPLSGPSSRLVSLQVSSPLARTSQMAAVPQDKFPGQTGTAPVEVSAEQPFPTAVENQELASSNCANLLPEVPCVARPIMASIAALGRRGQTLSQFQVDPQGGLRTVLNSATHPFGSELSGSLSSVTGRPFGLQHPQFTAAPTAYHSAVR